jgi:3-oxoacyl-[acyl-carrier-protein] synthase II
MTRRVVVTGIGIVSPVGIGTEQTWQALVKGESGVRRITLFDPTEYDCQIAGEVKSFEPTNWVERKDVKKMGRFIQFAVAASHMAFEQSGLKIDESNADRVGVLIGSGIGGFEVIEREYRTLLEKGPSRVSPFFIPGTIVNLAAGQVSIRTGARGPNSAVATACTTGAHAIGDAFKIIQRGAADAMICGGVEAAITPLAVAGFCAMRAMSKRNDDPERASRPWDKDREGFVLGEGGGILVLEEHSSAIARGAKIIAEIVGYGMSADAYHLSAPLESGDGILRVMKNALADAGIGAEKIGYLNAHATSTPLGDRGEALAIAKLFGAATKLAVSSTKSMTGHLLGGAGSLEAAVVILALRDQIAPPTINLEHPDEEITLDLVPNKAKKLAIEYAMTNSFGFGGTNGCLIFRTPTN